MRRYLLPVSVSLLFIAWSPFIGPLRDVIKRALGDAFTPVIGLGVGLTVLAAVGWGARHVRERRLQRVGVMSLAVLLFVGYAAVMRTGVPDVDAVERIHFVEYGLVATLFYRALAGMPLRLVVPLTLMIGVLVGIGEEWLQWLVPTRVGDVRDVFLNLYALGCGLLFAVGLYPPQTPAGAPAGVAWRGMLRLAGVVVLSFAGFLHCAHLGYELTDPAIGRFRSFFTFEQLAALGAERAERWRLDPPAAPEPFAIQDHYFFEAAAHIQHRNESYERGQFRNAWLENALLERYGPVTARPARDRLRPRASVAPGDTRQRRIERPRGRGRHLCQPGVRGPCHRDAFQTGPLDDCRRPGGRPAGRRVGAATPVDVSAGDGIRQITHGRYDREFGQLLTS